MPIPNVALTKTEFEQLQKSIVGVKKAVDDASQIAEDAVQYIADMQVAAPEVDLIVQFNSFLTLIEGLNVSSNYTAIVASLNTHGITRGGASSGSLSARLNDYFDNSVGGDIKISKAYQALSLAAGYEVTDTFSNDDDDYLALYGGHDNGDTSGETTDYPDTVTALTAGLSDGTSEYSCVDFTDAAGPTAHPVSGGTYTSTNPLKFSIDGLLPPGLGITQSSGKITGTIISGATNQNYIFTVKVEDTLGNTDKAKYSIAVTDV